MRIFLQSSTRIAVLIFLGLTLNGIAANWISDASALSRITATGNMQTENRPYLELLGHFGGDSNAVYAIDNYVYVGEGPRVTILDVADPANPVVLGKTAPLPRIVTRIYVVNQVAYVLNASDTLYIFDVSNPVTPILASAYKTPAAISDISVLNHKAFLLSNGLRIIDVTNPAAPSEVSFSQVPCAQSIYITETVAYLGTYNTFCAKPGLYLIDITQPIRPQEIGYYDSSPWDIEDIYVSNNIAYLATVSGGLRIVDVTLPSHIFERNYFDESGYVYHVHIVNNLAYLADEQGETKYILDITNPNQPQKRSQYMFWGITEDLHVANNIAYYAVGSDGLLFVNVTNPTSPIEVGFYRTLSYTSDVQVVGNRAYIADDSRYGLHIFDISNPRNPMPLTPSYKPTWGDDRHGYGVEVVGNYAYLASTTPYKDGLSILDISTPNALQQVALLELPEQYSYPYNLRVQNQTVFLGDVNYGLHIIDVANPMQPFNRASYDPEGWEHYGLYAMSNYAYVTSISSNNVSQNGLNIIDITDQFNPRTVGFFAIEHEAQAVYVTGNTAYTIDDRGKLYIIDLSNPQNPQEIGNLQTSHGSAAHALWVADNIAYIAANRAYLQLVDVGNPATSVTIDTWEIGRAYISGSGKVGIDVSENMIYFVDAASGFFILRYNPPTCYQLTLTHTGEGADPIATPDRSPGCAMHSYIADESIRVSSSPSAGWLIGGWSGTTNDNSTAGHNTVTMPATNHTARVNYVQPPTVTFTPSPTATPSHTATPTATATATQTATATPTSNRPPCPWNAQAEPVISPTDRLSQTIVINGEAGATVRVATTWGTFGAVTAAPYQVPITLLPNTVHTLTVTVNHNRVGGSPPTLCIETRTHDRLGAPLVIVQQAVTPTPTATPMPTLTPTATPTDGNTPTATPSPTLTATPTRPRASEGDDYETDNTCAQARAFEPDGSLYPHTFHTEADTDWVQFPVVAGAEYLIEVSIPPTSPADVVLELYNACDQLPLDGQDYTFSPGVRLRFTADATETIWLQLINHEPEVAGAQVRYDLSVRNLREAGQQGAAIIVAGKFRNNDPVDPNIYHVTKAARQLFIDHGYTDERIYYLAPDRQQANVDALATTANLEAAITTWAAGKVGPNQALTLYLMDHGDQGYFYLDQPRGERVTPEQLHRWLTVLEAKQPGVKINIIIEACYAGSFIRAAQSLSKPGRVIITSTDDENRAWASREGALFSDHLLGALQRGESLYNSFREAQIAARIANPAQHAWLDGDGNGQPEESSDQVVAAQRGFAFVGTFPADQWPPYIAQVQPPTTLENGRGQIRADVRDDLKVTDVWAVIYPPSYVAPTTGEALVQETLDTIKLLDQGNGWYGAAYAGFHEKGNYRIVLFAEDGQGMPARPVAINVETERQLFLPLVLR